MLVPCLRPYVALIIGSLMLALVGPAAAQTDCADGNGVLDKADPKGMTPQELIQKVVANETKVQEARSHYHFTQDVMVQTLSDNKVDGQYHQITAVSYDEKGHRLENVTFAEQSTLRGIQMSAEDMQDIREFMPWILSSDQAPQYNLTYMGRQHVDDLDTYVFHVVPKTEEKNKRYFEGRAWVDDRDLVIVKTCGKSVPEQARPKKKKNEPVDVRPTFATYRQIIDGNWFPVYSRVDDTLTFGVAESVHVREVVKFKDYKRSDATRAASKP